MQKRFNKSLTGRLKEGRYTLNKMKWVNNKFESFKILGENKKCPALSLLQNGEGHHKNNQKNLR